MKIKFNWGTGIMIAIIAFMAFIVTLVYKGTRIKHDLVSNNYYEDELLFQNQVDAQRNTKNSGLNNTVNLTIINKTINLFFADSLLSYPESGTIKIVHGQSSKFDKTFSFEDNTKKLISLDATDRPIGEFTLKMNLEIRDKKYYIEKEIYLK